MAKVPEDIRLALEGLAVLEEKFLQPLARLRDVIRVCVESEQKVEDAKARLREVQQQTLDAQRAQAQHVERSQTKLKSLAEQLTVVQGHWGQLEDAHKQRLSVSEQRLAEVEAGYATLSRQHGEMERQIRESTEELETLRARIKRAQTMEP